MPGSAKTLVRWSWRINHSLTACCVGNNPSKNYQNRLMSDEVIASQSSIVFWDTVYVLHDRTGVTGQDRTSSVRTSSVGGNKLPVYLDDVYMHLDIPTPASSSSSSSRLQSWCYEFAIHATLQFRCVWFQLSFFIGARAVSVRLVPTTLDWRPRCFCCCCCSWRQRWWWWCGWKLQTAVGRLLRQE